MLSISFLRYHAFVSHIFDGLGHMIALLIIKVNARPWTNSKKGHYALPVSIIIDEYKYELANDWKQWDGLTDGMKGVMSKLDQIEHNVASLKNMRYGYKK